jgi:Mn-dependent DtxR family transcriptional regulator
MGRPAKQEFVEAVFALIERYPGQRAGFFARRLGVARSQITRLLPGMERSGYLLSEDERGGLWPFRKPETSADVAESAQELC